VIKQILSWLKRTALGVMLLLPLAAAAQTSDKPFSNEQLDQMLAQIALYPDSLLRCFNWSFRSRIRLLPAFSVVGLVSCPLGRSCSLSLV
jgi:hypothetical protein